jgi:hypothetical protein
MEKEFSEFSETVLVNINDLHNIIKSSPKFTILFENDYTEDSNVNIPISKKFIFQNLEIENYEKFMHTLDCFRFWGIKDFPKEMCDYVKNNDTLKEKIETIIETFDDYDIKNLIELIFELELFTQKCNIYEYMCEKNMLKVLTYLSNHNIPNNFKSLADKCSESGSIECLEDLYHKYFKCKCACEKCDYEAESEYDEEEDDELFDNYFYDYSIRCINCEFVHKCNCNLQEILKNSLEKAVMNGHLNIVKYLYKKIYDPEIYGLQYHQDLFEIAASRNYINIFKYLYDIFPDKDEIETDFIYNDAVGDANLELVKFFVENNITFGDFERFSVNITLEHIPMMKYLMENGWTLSTHFDDTIKK